MSIEIIGGPKILTIKDQDLVDLEDHDELKAFLETRLCSKQVLASKNFNYQESVMAIMDKFSDKGLKIFKEHIISLF